MRKIRIVAQVEPEIGAKIGAMAEREERTASAMIAILVKEALAARDKKARP